MKSSRTLRFALSLASLAAAGWAPCQSVQPMWSGTWHMDPYTALPTCMAVQQTQNGWIEKIGAVLSGTGSLNQAGYQVDLGRSVVASNAVAPHFIPADVSFMLSFNSSTQVPIVLGKLVTGNGSKVALYQVQPGMPGAQLYVYNPSASTNDQPLTLGTQASEGYAVASVQTAPGSVRQLVVLAPPPMGTAPVIEGTDPLIAPAQAFFAGKTLYAAGTDNHVGLAFGGARATVYSIKDDGTVGQVFTKAIANTTAGNVANSYQFLWAPLDAAHNYLITKLTVHDIVANTYHWSYTVQLMDAAGNVQWTSASAPGYPTQASAGSVNDIYVRGLNGAGDKQFVTSYNQVGGIRWAKSIPSVAFANALTGGVIVGDNEVDETGHRHVHLTRYLENGTILWTIDYQTLPSNDDYLADLRWISGHIFIDGQSTPAPGMGSKFVFGAEYDQTAAPPSLKVTNLPSTYLTIPSYDGSGQETEPDVIYVPTGWNGFAYWMTAAPYPSSNYKLENPSIWATNDPPGPNQHWIVPPGVTNPVVPQVGNVYNADQSIFLDSDGTMYLYYDSSDGVTKDVSVISSRDGWKTHSAPTNLFHSTVQASYSIVSNVLRDPATGKYHLWHTERAQSPRIFLRWTGDSPLGPFSNRQVCTFNGMPPNYSPWEQNMVRSPRDKNLYALFTLGLPGAQGPPLGGTGLYFLSSSDEGLTWTIQPNPVIKVGPAGSWDDQEMYRGTLTPTAATLEGTSNAYDIWYSAFNKKSVWHIAYAGGIVTP